MLTWKTEYETGVALVDNQHRVLFEQINKLEQLAAAPRIDKAEIDRLLAFLGNYAASHFTYEEQCMHRFHCPAHGDNVRAHAQFIEVFTRFMADYQVQGPTPELLRRLQSTASAWIQSHILKVDLRLRDVAAR